MPDSEAIPTGFESIPAEISEIVERAQAYANQGYRLIQIGCTRTPAEMDLIYTFEKPDYQVETLKIPIEEGGVIPSISGVFYHAFAYENEIHDLYGITVTDMAIDFGGKFYETKVKYPFSLTTNIGEKE